MLPEWLIKAIAEELKGLEFGEVSLLVEHGSVTRVKTYSSKNVGPLRRVA